METFAQRLKLCRKRKRLTQKAAAEAVDIAFSTYRRYEQGISEPVLSDAVRIADFFGVTLDYLAGQSDYPTQLM